MNRVVRCQEDIRFLGPKLGRYFMMAALGAAFGNTVMGRISAAIGRLQFIFLKRLGPGT
ncbi:MAG: hypothetical protein IMW97_05075 [Firmicutes bacterium]|nr:hypothetical protein [Candidatus Fermentithermobacillaceae bacterium]